jgi:hypothetical protein
MLKDHKELIQKLNAHAVKHLVVGGHAVGLYAEPRGTKDLDVFIKADEENSKARCIGGIWRPAGRSDAERLQ